MTSLPQASFETSQHGIVVVDYATNFDPVAKGLELPPGRMDSPDSFDRIKLP
jgi:hypothetical protein